MEGSCGGRERSEASQPPRQLDQPSPVPQGFSQFRVVPPEGPSSQVRPDGTASQKVAESLVLVSALRVGELTLLPDLGSVACQQCRVVGAEPSRLRFPGAETELLGLTWLGACRCPGRSELTGTALKKRVDWNRSSHSPCACLLSLDLSDCRPTGASAWLRSAAVRATSSASSLPWRPAWSETYCRLRLVPRSAISRSDRQTLSARASVCATGLFSRRPSADWESVQIRTSSGT